MKKVLALLFLASALSFASVSASPVPANSSHDTVYSLPADAPVVFTATNVSHVDLDSAVITDSFCVLPAMNAITLFYHLPRVNKYNHLSSYSMTSEQAHKHILASTNTRFSNKSKYHSGWRVPHRC